jgi:hypothetical protein
MSRFVTSPSTSLRSVLNSISAKFYVALPICIVQNTKFMSVIIFVSSTFIDTHGGGGGKGGYETAPPQANF